MACIHRAAAIVSCLWLLFSPGLAGAAGKPAAVDAARLSAADGEAGNWMSHGRTYREQRFSLLGKVNEENIDQLGLAWQFKYDLDRVVEATPIVVDGVLYTTGAYSMVYALDATNGKLLWKYDPEGYRGIQGTGCCDAANRGVAVWKGRVYVGEYDGRLVALDARTGRKVWSVDTVIDHERNKQLEAIVHSARSHLGMPPFGDRLETDDIEKIRAFLIRRAHDLRDEIAAAQAATEDKTI